MKNKRNYYRLLHVQFDAPAAVIKSSYRSMMQKMRMHPDLGGDEEYAKLLNEALSVLLDEDKRAEYNQLQKEKLHGQRRSYDSTDSEKSKRANIKRTQKKAKEFVDKDNCVFCGSAIIVDSVNAYESTLVNNYGCAVCSAPTQRVELYLSEEGNEIRGLPRVDYDLSIKVQFQPSKTALATAKNGNCYHPSTTNIVQMEMQDFSVRGASLLSSVELLADQRILILSDEVNAVAEVKHSHQEDFGNWIIGVQFLTLRLDVPKGEILSSRC